MLMIVASITLLVGLILLVTTIPSTKMNWAGNIATVGGWAMFVVAAVQGSPVAAAVSVFMAVWWTLGTIIIIYILNRRVQNVNQG